MIITQEDRCQPSPVLIPLLRFYEIMQTTGMLYPEMLITGLLIIEKKKETIGNKSIVL